MKGRNRFLKNREELQSYIDKYRKLLIGDLEWWQKYTPDTKHGGFYSYLGRDGKVLFTGKNVRQQGRNVQRVEPCPHHPIGLEKYAKFGIPVRFDRREQPTAEDMRRWRCSLKEK